METNHRSAGGGWSPATFALPIIAAFLLAVLLLFGASGGSRDGVHAQDPEATETPKPQKSDHECDDDPSLAFCPPPPPWGISLSFSDDDLTINYRRSAWQGSSGHSYRFELSRSTRRTGGYSTHATINDSIPPANRYNLDKGYWYRVRGKRCHGSSCGAWSSYSFPKWLAPPPTATFTPTPKATATPAPPPPPTNLRLTLFGGDDVRVNYSRSYWSGSSSHYYRFEMEQFDVGTKDYDFYRRVDDSASPAYFRNLEVGNSYRVRGKRCTSSSRTVCGRWSGWREIGVYPPPTPTPTDTPTPVPSATHTPTPVPPPPPTNLRLSLDGNDVRVGYAQSRWSGGIGQYYRFTLLYTDSPKNQYREYSYAGGVVDTNGSPFYFYNVSAGFWYKVVGRRCAGRSGTRCGEESRESVAVFYAHPTPVPTDTPVPPTATSVPPTATSVPPTATPVPPTATPVPPTVTSTPTPAPAKLSTPQNIDVEPRPLRVARISWDAVDGANAYVVRLHNHIFEEKDDKGLIIGLVADIGIACVDDDETHYDVNLDKHLIDEKDDELEVKAIKDECSVPQETRDTNPMNSEYSSKIRIVDSAIIRADGDNSGISNSHWGSATIKWNRIPGVSKYTINHRLLGGTHTNRDGWYPYSYVKLSNMPEIVEDRNSSSSTPLTHTINNLNLGEIYAIQLNYTDQNGVQVFSGRDAFVWPSKRPPEEEDENVATYPFFGHWPKKEYVYRICENTFPSSTRQAWINVITRAFKQWETSTDGLVKLTEDSEKCELTEGPPINELKELKLNVNEVYMVDVDLHRKKPGRFTDYIKDYRGRCVLGTNVPACVISHAYGKAVSGNRRLSNDADSTYGVDVLFSKDVFGTKPIAIPSSVVFNQCIRKENGQLFVDSGKDDVKAYEIALHEAGHALGLSNVLTGDVVNDVVAHIRDVFLGGILKPLAQWANGEAINQRSHPSIPDSVMNHNSEIQKIIPGDWDEPDCSPHPFDLLVINALYQTVK